MKVAVIGAGPAGITAAYSLAKSNLQVDVYEASAEVGGLAKTMELWGQKVDIGPHRFFSTDKRVNALWLEVVGTDYQMVDRLTRIYYKNKFYSYPIKVFNVLKNLGLIQAGLCFFSYMRECVYPTRQDGSFETWVQQRFGKKLFNIFFKTYTEKLWGVKCSELDSDFASQRIKKLSLYEAIKNALIKDKANKHKTLVEQFAYPLEGTGIVYKRMADFVKASGNNVYLNTPVFRVIDNGRKVIGIELEDGTFKEYDYVISSMPYTLMVSRLQNVPPKIKSLANNLKYRNTIIVYLLVDSVTLFPDNWIYVHSDDLKMGRVTNFRNWTPGLYGSQLKSILAIEYWCNDEDTMWMSNNDDLVEMAMTEIVKTQLVKPETIEKGYVHKIHKSYPVYKKGYKDSLNVIDDYIGSLENLSVIGRYGSFKYNNQDHSILMGLLAAENIVNGTGHDLYAINTDYETYQESHIITEAGLFKN